MSDQYKFTFNADNTAVTRMYEVKGRKLKLKNEKFSTFDVEVGVNDQGLTAVTSVTQNKLSKGFSETSVFTDQDGNGIFQESFEIEVATGGVRASNLEKHKFSFDLSGNVTADYELKKGKWKLDRIDYDEEYTSVNLDGADYILKTEQERSGVEFELFRDDNSDGVWTKIAEGEARSEFLDPTTGTVDLVGVQEYLAAADALVG